MKSPTLKILQATYKAHNTITKEQDGKITFTIINPIWDGNIDIEIEPDEEGGDGIIFIFPRHHAHFDCDIEGLIAYINDFMQGELVAVTLYKGDEYMAGCSWHSAAEISSDDVINIFAGDRLRPGSNATWREYYNDAFKGYPARFTVDAWDSARNQDVEFAMTP